MRFAGTLGSDPAESERVGWTHRVGRRWLRRHGEPRAGRERVVARFRRSVVADQLRDRVRPEHLCDAVAEDPAKAVADPAASLGWGFDQQAPARELTRAQRLQPDAVGGLVDGEGKLCLHACPYVLELGAHGSVYPLLS